MESRLPSAGWGSAPVNDLERRFHRARIGIYEKAKRETGYNATRFLQMVSELGGLAAARRLLAAPAASDGFTALWERGRLDLTVETLVLSEQYRELFSDEEREGVAARLAAYRRSGG
jgi:hypothetical protein